MKLVQSIRNTPQKVFEEIKPELTNELIKKIEERIGGTESTRNIEQWSRYLSLHHLYVEAYRLFYQDVHSSPRALDKLFMTNEEKEIIGFEWRPKGDEDLRAELMEAIRYLIHGMSFINKLFGLNIGGKLGTFES